MKKKPFRLSVTRAKGFLDCAASWFFAEVLGLDQGPKPSAELGTKVHAVLEGFARGEVTRSDIEAKAHDRDKPFAVAYRGLTHLEDTIKAAGLTPGAKGLHVEEWVRDEVPLGAIGTVPFTGKVDLWWVDLGGTLHILDHKTSSDPRKWGLSRQGVQRDLQLLVYAYQVARRTGHTGPVMGHIIYYPTKNGHALRVDALRPWTERDLVCAWEDLVEIAQEMAGTYLTEAPQKNLGHCRSYGGCPFQTACKGLPEMEMNPVDHALAALKPFPTPTTLQIERAAARARCTIEDLKVALATPTAPQTTATTGLRAEAQAAKAPKPSTNVIDMAERIRAYLDGKVNVTSVTSKSVEQAAERVGTPVETLVTLAGLVPKDGGWALGPKPEPQAEVTKAVEPQIEDVETKAVEPQVEDVETEPEVELQVEDVETEPQAEPPCGPDVAPAPTSDVVVLPEAAPGWPEGLEEDFTVRPAPPLEEKELQVFITILSEGLPRTGDSCHQVAKEQGLWTRMHTDRKARVLQAFRCWEEVRVKGDLEKEDTNGALMDLVEMLKASTEAARSEVETLTERCAYLEKEAEIIPLLEAEVERLKDDIQALDDAEQAEAESLKDDGAEALPSVILVDAVPDSTSRPLRDVLDEFFVKVEVEKHVADVALIDYNKGFVLANAYFARALRDGWKAPTGFYTARSDEPYLRHFEHTLRRAGFRFVRGVR